MRAHGKSVKHWKTFIDFNSIEIVLDFRIVHNKAFVSISQNIFEFEKPSFHRRIEISQTGLSMSPPWPHGIGCFVRVQTYLAVCFALRHVDNTQPCSENLFTCLTLWSLGLGEIHWCYHKMDQQQFRGRSVYFVGWLCAEERKLY